MSGFFIVVEGLDGAGKSTLIQGLSRVLGEQGHAVVPTKEPGATLLGKKIRELVQGSDELGYGAEFLLFAADRAEHVRRVIKPALAHGNIVISDRFTFSSLAYQGYGRGVDKNFITMVNAFVTQGLQPDVTLFVALDSHIAMERIDRRGEEKARFEKNAYLLARAAEGFNEIMRFEPSAIILEGSLPPQTLLQQAFEAIEKKILLWVSRNKRL